MLPLDMKKVESYISDNIDTDFFDKNIAKLKNFTLSDVVKRKNPYLFKAKRIERAQDYIQQVLDATVSSGEESIFGDFLERLALQVCEQVYGAYKSSAVGIDIEFSDDGKRYIVSVKSGPNWGNSGQIRALKKNFVDAKRILSTSGGARGQQIICIEGCCYGIDNRPDKDTHLKLCGQRFWEFLSAGNENLYRELIEPLGNSSEAKSFEVESLYNQKLNLLTAEFIALYCDEGLISWDRLLKANSGKTD